MHGIEKEVGESEEINRRKKEKQEEKNQGTRNMKAGREEKSFFPAMKNGKVKE